MTVLSSMEIGTLADSYPHQLAETGGGVELWLELLYQLLDQRALTEPLKHSTLTSGKRLVPSVRLPLIRPTSWTFKIEMLLALDSIQASTVD